MQLYVDMDGVLVDFRNGYKNTFGIESNKVLDNIDWNLIRTTPNFFLSLPPMPDLDILWSTIKQFNPIILTAIPSVTIIPEAAQNKKSWINKYLSDKIEIRCCRAPEKCLHCNPGDILIEDWEKHKKKWIKKGGVWITHINALNTIAELYRYLKLIGEPI